MKLVVDANILFSFFKKDSTPRELILDPELKYGLELFAPALMLEEISRHKSEICPKFSLAPKDFDVMFSSIRLFVNAVDNRVFDKFFPEAKTALSGNVKDVPYAALSFWFKEQGNEIFVWSNDKGLKVLEKRRGIRVFSTGELVDFLSAKKEP